MAQYEVTQTWTQHITVEADSANEAEQIALSKRDEEWTDDGCDMSAVQLDDESDLDDEDDG